MDYRYNRAWAEIDLDAISNNVREVRRITKPNAEIMGIVKADGYGHGAMEVANTLIENGVSRLGVAILDEAIQLRKNGIKVPILVLSYTDPRRAKELIKYDITQTIYSHELAKYLSEVALAENATIKVHVKVDTGMGRVGFLPGYSAVKDVMKISALKGLIVEGLFTHFAQADTEDRTYTLNQFEMFMSIVNELKRVGIHIPILHVANSGAIIQYPSMHLDIVRAGIILYGHYPSAYTRKYNLNLKPAMTLKAGVNMVKTVEKDTCISYGSTYKTDSKRTIATITIGYADGYSRLLSNKSKVLINGEFAPIVGNICMDQCMADVTHFEKKPGIGDEVVLFGSQMNNSITCEELADIMGTINYEIISLVGKRVPRIYIKNGEVVNVLNYICPDN